MIEQRALELLGATEPKPLEARRLLAEATQATPLFGLKTGMRLFDLLAGLTVRFNLRDERDALIRVLQAELTRVRTLEQMAGHWINSTGPVPAGQNNEVPRAGRALVFLYQLSGNGSPAAEPQNQRRTRRHHEPHHMTRQEKYKGSVHAQLGHNEFLRAVVEDRIEKWQETDSRWYGRWSNRKTPVKWAGITIA
jgi:hypothetical protein